VFGTLGFARAIAALIGATLWRPRTGSAVLQGIMLIRSLAFNIFLYVFTALCSVLALCAAIFWPSRLVMISRLWSHGLLGGYRLLCGVTFRVRGAEHMPDGSCIIAMKHQSIWESWAAFAIFRQPIFVLKSELLWIPIFGWVTLRMGCIRVKRGAGKAALDSMIRGAHRACARGKQIIIFPEGTRSAPGAAPHYKSGVSHLYKALQIPCVPVALNSGLLWPKRGFSRPPGVITVEILPPISVGLSRQQMFERLERDIEAGCRRLGEA
jgi:1-acyl-sn-glycerol-3-phosphate acyltransferase